jgi:hypothetical protein
MLWQQGTHCTQIALHVSQARENVAVPVHHSVLPAHGYVLVPRPCKRRIAAVLLTASAIPADVNIMRSMSVRSERLPFCTLSAGAAWLTGPRIHNSARSNITGME